MLIPLSLGLRPPPLLSANPPSNHLPLLTSVFVMHSVSSGSGLIWMAGMSGSASSSSSPSSPSSFLFFRDRDATSCCSSPASSSSPSGTGRGLVADNSSSSRTPSLDTACGNGGGGGELCLAGLRCFFFCFRVDWHWGGEEETDEMKGRKSDRIQGSGRGETGRDRK